MRLSVVILGTERWPINRRKWRHAEELGFHAAYTYDHLSWRSFREKPWFSMVPLLAAAALETTTIRLGPLVTSPNFRHPLLLAKDLIALDDISGGRIVVGVGSGGRGFDATVLGTEMWSGKERHERFKEFTTNLEELLREDRSSITGEFYPVVESRQLPGPLQSPRPPLFISALGPKSIDFAVSLGDGWVSVGSARPSVATLDAVRFQSTLVNEALEKFDRDPRHFERLLLDGENEENPLSSYNHFIDWAGSYHELGINELVLHYPVADSIFDYDPTIFERIGTEGRQTIGAWS